MSAAECTWLLDEPESLQLTMRIVEKNDKQTEDRNTSSNAVQNVKLIKNGNEIQLQSAGEA